MHTGCLHPLNDKIKLPMRHVEFMKGIFMDNITIRTAKPSDADKLLEIYAPYVEKTAITFEYEVPSVDEFRQRIENTLKKYPYIVAIRMIKSSDMPMPEHLNQGRHTTGMLNYRYIWI